MLEGPGGYYRELSRVSMVKEGLVSRLEVTDSPRLLRGFFLPVRPVRAADGAVEMEVKLCNCCCKGMFVL